MFAIIVIIVAVAVVCLLVRHYISASEIPPNAQLICDLWEQIEESS